MARSLNSCTVDKGVSRNLRRRLAMTTILAVAPLLGYGRQAYAACIPSSGTIFICSGSSAGEDFTVNNADFRTAADPHFEVTTNGVALDGLGHIRFTDNNASSITNTGGAGLDVRSNGDDPGTNTPGAVTIITNGTITGSTDGIYSLNEGSGNLSITLDGTVTGETQDGVQAINSSDGNNFDIATGIGSALTGASDGLDIENDGNGHLKITVDGDVTGNDGNGIEADNEGTYLAITTGAGSVIKGHEYGIDADNDGSGNLDVTVRGQVTGETMDGILAHNEGSALTVTTETGSDIHGFLNGINASNEGLGDLNVNARGTVTSETLDGILAYNSERGGNLTITTGAGSEITGGDDGIQAGNYGHDNLTITVDGTVTGENAIGIQARNISGDSYNPYTHETYHAYGVDLTITTGAASKVYGHGYGIFALNQGTGNLTITVDGQVTGHDSDGAYAYNGEGGNNLFVTTGDTSTIMGNSNGINANNHGTGALEITADGEVYGYNKSGIYAYNSPNGIGMTIKTGSNSVITGNGRHGIFALNYGNGNLDITANGIVTGRGDDGIHAYNAGPNAGFNPGHGVDLIITTGAASLITGARDGIFADNYHATGKLEITANGQVTGQDGDGIRASNQIEGLDLTITTGVGSNITGGFRGIDATNYGASNLDIKVYGQVTGEGVDGIIAQNGRSNVDTGSGDLTVLTGAASVVHGYNDGIDADNYGHGKFEITVDGEVTGQDNNGINAYNSARGLNMKITTGVGSVVTGFGDDGISAHQYGDGALEITVNGSVSGQGLDDATGSGIIADNEGTGITDIKVGGNGLVEGYFAGIHAYSTANEAITITNDGFVRNLSGESNDLAIKTTGGVSTVNNNNLLIGTVSLSALDDTLNNAGLWNTAKGSNDFGGGEDEVNNTGTLQAADDPTISEATVLENLETFGNSGLVTLVDGKEGDSLTINNDGNAPEYIGKGGKLAVDAFLDPAGASDQLFIFGNSSGTTSLVVNLTNPIGSSPNFVGIPVITVSGGNTAEADFNVEGGVLNAGFFAWNLELDGDTHELITVGLGAASFEFAAGITGAQDIWHESTGTVLQRQADLRALLAGTQVTPVADFSEPIEPTPVAHVTPGLWLKGVGAYLERDQDEANNVSTDRKQEIYGFLGGFDFGTQSAGEAWLFGLFGGYLTSDLDFDQTNTEWHYEGPSVGAYATYLNDAFYADVTVKADFLDVDIDASDIAPGDGKADTDALNIGGLIDTGYKVPLDHGLFVEPQASLAVVHTEIDDINDIFGGAVEFDDETSVRGRLGLRLGHELTASNQVIYSSDVTASVWEEFNDDNNATIFAPLFPTTGVADDPGETFGDVSIGFSAQSPEGWSSFLRGNYTFASDYDAFAGNAGLRYAW